MWLNVIIASLSHVYAQNGDVTPYIPGKSEWAVQHRISELRLLERHLHVPMDIDVDYDEGLRDRMGIDEQPNSKSNVKPKSKPNVKSNLKPNMQSNLKMSLNGQNQTGMSHTVNAVTQTELVRTMRELGLPVQRWTDSKRTKLVRSYEKYMSGECKLSDIARELSEEPRSVSDHLHALRNAHKKLKAHKGALALAHFFQTRSQKIGHEVERRNADTHGSCPLPLAPGQHAGDTRAREQAVKKMAQTSDPGVERTKRRHRANSELKYVQHSCLICDYSLPLQRLSYDTPVELLSPIERKERGLEDVGPLPSNAAIDLCHRRALIPPEWRFHIPLMRIDMGNISEFEIYIDYIVCDVRRSTKISELTDDIGKWLMRMGDFSKRVTDLRVNLRHNADGSWKEIDSDGTAESVDLFNKMPHIAICIADGPGYTQMAGTLGGALNNAAQGAANSNPVGAPSHLAMVANLANDAGQNVGFHQDTNLADMQTDDWAKLKDHMSEINQYPQCVCFNCGITMYPTDVKKIVAMGITKKEQCQGYHDATLLDLVFERFYSLSLRLCVVEPDQLLVTPTC